MKLRLFFARFREDQSGSAAEFALVLPLFALLFVGLIDAGRYAYSFNQGEKATQTGARWAVVTNPLTPELAAETYVGAIVSAGVLTQGDRIPEDALGLITCTSAACICTTAPCPDSLTLDPNTDANGRTPFNAMLNRMQQIMPEITAANLVVEYSSSGLGYAGNPNGMDIAPLVTVRLQDMDFTSFMLFGGTVGLPDFSYTLTMEDGQGTGSN